MYYGTSRVSSRGKRVLRVSISRISRISRRIKILMHNAARSGVPPKRYNVATEGRGNWVIWEQWAFVVACRANISTRRRNPYLSTRRKSSRQLASTWCCPPREFSVEFAHERAFMIAAIRDHSGRLSTLLTWIDRKKKNDVTSNKDLWSSCRNSLRTTTWNADCCREHSLGFRDV